jgi:hypothetical protein
MKREEQRKSKVRNTTKQENTTESAQTEQKPHTLATQKILLPPPFSGGLPGCISLIKFGRDYTVTLKGGVIMQLSAALCLSFLLLLSPVPTWAEEDDNTTITFPYTLAELEELIDSSPQLRLLAAKQQETRNKESLWHDISVSAGFNPIRTADKFTDRIRGGFAVSMPLDILLFRDTARVSREVEGLEMEKLRGDLKRELRKLWFERERRLVEIRQAEAERELAKLKVQKAGVLLVSQDASLDTVKEAEVVVSRIEAGMVNKKIDIRDLEDGMLTLVGKGR